MDFSGHTALVTGSSRGLGAAFARAFAAAGAHVVVNHRSPDASAERAAALVAELEAAGRRAIAVRADISDRREVVALMARVREELGRLDHLVLNAARAPFKPLERLLERDLRQLVDTNFVGNILCLREALPLLEETSGTVVFVSSLGSRRYLPEYPLGSMKAAMEAVVRDCALSLRDRGIAVNGVCAGLARTDSLKTLRTAWPAIEHLDEGHFVTPGEVAGVVLFLCSPRAAGIVGQTVVVDRGLGHALVL
jgi:NAD(P)-dependent dehydrogenase (short-subunit alcohol dehydrogenase family)